jgi:hypothetical protein
MARGRLIKALHGPTLSSYITNRETGRRRGWSDRSCIWILDHFGGEEVSTLSVVDLQDRSRRSFYSEPFRGN